MDIVVLEYLLHQMLCEWKAELNEPSPSSSLQVCINFRVNFFLIVCGFATIIFHFQTFKNAYK